jgi:hypothetical protein
MSNSLPSPKRRRLSSPLDGVSYCMKPTVGAGSRRVVDDVAITTGRGLLPMMFEALSLHELEMCSRETSLRAQYFAAMSEAARKDALNATEHVETLGALILLKKGIQADLVSSSV